MRRVLVIVPIFCSLVAGCVNPPGRASCPPSGAQPGVIEETTPGDFAEWEERTLRYAAGLVGMAESAAEQCALDQGFSWRVVGRDGEFFPVTADYSPSRINATIVGGVVDEVSAG